MMSLTLGACRTHYQLTDATSSRILIDKRYDAQPDAQAAQFLAPYRHQVDSIMGPVVGKISSDMYARRPESKLSNLLSDILLWGAEKYHEKADFAVYNMGGIRAALAKGEVTYGDVVDVAPFENKICLLTLSGSKVKELFSQIAMRGGEGVSHGVELRISREGKLLSASVNGKPIDEGASYRISTLDYVAQGNDQMTAFKSATNVFSPQEQQDNVRYLIVDYLRDQAKQGIVVDRDVEGRIKIVE
jgi:2',3'-cyclic-nucleotide 2'-phosphodiesterase (5'-nucleotidase family)